ncbi:MAG: HAMP domain-containing methyl-accepting chemotaxis protein [Pseudomonadota bacterium]
MLNSIRAKVFLTLGLFFLLVIGIVLTNFVTQQSQSRNMRIVTISQDIAFQSTSSMLLEEQLLKSESAQAATSLADVRKIIESDFNSLKEQPDAEWLEGKLQKIEIQNSAREVLFEELHLNSLDIIKQTEEHLIGITGVKTKIDQLLGLIEDEETVLTMEGEILSAAESALRNSLLELEENLSQKIIAVQRLRFNKRVKAFNADTKHLIDKNNSEYLIGMSDIQEFIQSVDNDEYNLGWKNIRSVWVRVIAIEKKIAKAVIKYNELNTQLETSRKQMQTLVASILSNVTQQFEETGKTGKAISAAILLIALALGGVLTVWFSKVVISPIHHTVAMLKDIAQGEGDLTVRLNESEKNELGELAHWFNVFTSKIQQMIAGMGGAINSLTSSAEQLSHVANETSSGLSRQQEQTEQVATAMNEMAATAREVAKNAQEASLGAKKATDEALEGRQVVDDSAVSIQELRSEIVAAVEIVRRLELGSIEIGGVLEVIQNIAEQTNLLALNAAIEAARAGEQGRGFAVVADEVRTLATRTQQSTQEIQKIIEHLQSASTEAAQAMKRSQEKVSDGIQNTTRADTALEKIVSAIGPILDMNTLIASAAEEQSSVAEEINRNVVVINDVTLKTAQGADKTADASTEIDQLTSQLKQSMTQFKV